MNTYGYVGGNPIRYTDSFGLHHDGKGCVDPKGNRVPCPRDVCVTAECAAGIPPTPKTSDCANCRAACVANFVNPVPGLTIEKGVGKITGKFNPGVVPIAKDVTKKVNKVKGAYDFGVCMDSCKSTCKSKSCADKK